MTVEIVWGTGSGSEDTPLAAFDTALDDAGLHNYNLTRLSSILPQGAEVVETGALSAVYSVGTVIGVVLARTRVDEDGTTVAAGLGWSTAEEGGVLMEATATSVHECRDEIRRSLRDARKRRDWHWEDSGRFRVVEHEGDAGDTVVVAAVLGPLKRWDTQEVPRG